MQTFEDMKKLWNEDQGTVPSHSSYDQKTFQHIVKSRTAKHMKTSMQYFWAAFVLQIIVYALLSHVIVRYGSDPQTLTFSVAGILLFLPFTIMLMRKFKRMAVTRHEGDTNISLYDDVSRKRQLLQSFYTFKKRYELVLVPLSSAIGVFLTFKLFVPGGVTEHVMGAIITLIMTLVGMAWSIRSENKKSFEKPIRDLSQLLDEFGMQR